MPDMVAPPDRFSHQVGKVIHGRLYVHRSAWPLVRHKFHEEFRSKVERLLNQTEVKFNVIRAYESGREVAFLEYADFFDDPFPCLSHSRTHKLETNMVRERAYGLRGNPPILHRKELMIAPDDPRRGEYEALTQTLEEAGLFNEPTKIGYLKMWQQRLEAAGFTSDGQRVR